MAVQYLSLWESMLHMQYLLSLAEKIGQWEHGQCNQYNQQAENYILDIIMLLLQFHPIILVDLLCEIFTYLQKFKSQKEVE